MLPEQHRRMISAIDDDRRHLTRVPSPRGVSSLLCVTVTLSVSVSVSGSVDVPVPVPVAVSVAVCSDDDHKITSYEELAQYRNKQLTVRDWLAARFLPVPSAHLLRVHWRCCT